MSIIIHVKKSSQEGCEDKDDVNEDSLIESSVIRRIKSSVNKPFSTNIQSNDLKRIDNTPKANLTTGKVNTVREKSKEISELVKAIGKCETDSNSLEEVKVELSE